MVGPEWPWAADTITTRGPSMPYSRIDFIEGADRATNYEWINAVL